MSWNHRVVRKEYTYPDGYVEVSYGIHEVFYVEGETSLAFTTNPVAPVGESVEELRITLERMLRALDKPVIDYETREEL